MNQEKKQLKRQVAVILEDDLILYLDEVSKATDKSRSEIIRDIVRAVRDKDYGVQ